MGYHDGTQNFIIEKYGILAFKWRVLSIFSISGSKLESYSKKQKDAGEMPRVVPYIITEFHQVIKCSRFFYPAYFESKPYD